MGTSSEHYMAIAFGPKKEYGVVLPYASPEDDSEMLALCGRALRGSVAIRYLGGERQAALDAIHGLAPASAAIDRLSDDLVAKIFVEEVLPFFRKALERQIPPF